VNHFHYEQAAPLLTRALEIRRRIFGANHTETAAALVKLGALAYETGDYETARKHFDEAHAVLSRLLGANHPRVVNVLHRLGVIDAAMGDLNGSLARMLDAISREDSTLDDALSFGTEQQRIAFLDTLRRHLHRLLALVLAHLQDSPHALRAALQCVLRRKGLRLSETAAQRALARTSDDAVLRDLLHREITLDARITRSLLDGPRGINAVHRKMLAEWVADKERVEDKIAKRAPGITVTDSEQFDLDLSAAAIPEGAVLAEFVRFPQLHFKAIAQGQRRPRQDRYAALTLPPGAPHQVQLLDLGEAEIIDASIASFRSSLIPEAARGRDFRPREPVQSSPNAGSQLRAMILDPLTACSPETTRWIIAPESNTSWLPFDALPLANGERAFDRYAISYVSSGRDLIRGPITVLSGSPVIVPIPILI